MSASQRGRRCIYCCLSDAFGCGALFELFAGDSFALPQLFGALGLAAGKRQLAANPCEIGLGQLYAGLVGTRIDNKKHVALADQFTFLEADLIDITADPGP